MTDLAIASTTNDISLTKGEVNTVVGNSAKAQRIRSKLLTVKGEWFLDTNFGLDYHGVVWVKSTPRQVLVAHVQKVILEGADAGDQITSFDLDYNGVTRALSISADLTGVDGLTITVTV